MDREVIVRGEAEQRTLPDRAVLRITVRGDGASREDAYRAAATDASAVDEVLGRRLPDGQQVGHGSLVVQPKSKWKKGESVRTGWVATRMTTVETQELSSLGELFAELAAAGADVIGPEWQVDPRNPAHEQARKAAAGEARQRAEAYADALGLTLGDVQWVAEPGLRAGGSEHHAVAFAAAAGAPMRSAASEESINLSPPELTVRSAVEVGFKLAAPAR